MLPYSRNVTDYTYITEHAGYLLLASQFAEVLYERVYLLEEKFPHLRDGLYQGASMLVCQMNEQVRKVIS